MTAFTLGPLSLPPAHLYAACVAVALLALGHLVRLPPPRRRLWLTGALLGALLGARLADIALHGGAYREAPLEAVMRWQSGYHPLGALLGAGAWTLGCLRRLPPRYLTRASGVLATCAALWWGLNAWHPLAGEPPPSHLPPLSLNALDGDAISLEALSTSSPLIVVLWRSDCHACRQALARANAVADQVRVITVNEGQSLLQAARFLDAQDMGFARNLQDPEQRLQAYFGMPELPLAVYLDAHGRLRNIRSGPLATARLEAWLAASP